MPGPFFAASDVAFLATSDDAFLLASLTASLTAVFVTLSPLSPLLPILDSESFSGVFSGASGPDVFVLSGEPGLSDVLTGSPGLVVLPFEPHDSGISLPTPGILRTRSTSLLNPSFKKSKVAITAFEAILYALSNAFLNADANAPANASANLDSNSLPNSPDSTPHPALMIFPANSKKFLVPFSRSQNHLSAAAPRKPSMPSSHDFF